MPHFFHSTELWIFFCHAHRKGSEELFSILWGGKMVYLLKICQLKVSINRGVEKESGLTWEILFFVCYKIKWMMLMCLKDLISLRMKSSSSLFKNVKDLPSWTFHKQMPPTTIRKLHRVANQKTVIQEFIKPTKKMR